MINLALQGGGARGAFTWGVLDRLLEDGRGVARKQGIGKLIRIETDGLGMAAKLHIP